MKQYQITNLKDLEGKTIHKVMVGTNGELYIRFAKTFVILEASYTSSSNYNYQTEVTVDDYPACKTDSDLVELGVLSKSEHKDAIRQDEIETETRYAKEEELRLKEVEARERQLLDELQKKFN